MSEKEEKGNQTPTTPNDTIDAAINRPSKISSFFAFSEKLASSEYLRWLMIALLPILILLEYKVDGSDYDLWWQMAMGKYYITHHTLIMDHSIFSWTPTDPTWIYNTCLGSIAVYLFYNFMGGFRFMDFSMADISGSFSFFLSFSSSDSFAAGRNQCNPYCRHWYRLLYCLSLLQAGIVFRSLF